MKYKRWFRVLVCLVLVCALIVNISPVRARATAIVAGLTVAEIAGYLALILGTTAGAVYIVNNREEVSAVGQKIIDVWIDPEAYLDHLVSLTSNINGMWDPGDGSGYDPRLGTKLARGLLAAIAGSLVASVVAGHMEGEEEVEVEIPEGYASYNGYILPLYTQYGDCIPECDYNCCILYYSSSDRYDLLLTNGPITFKASTNPYLSDSIQMDGKNEGTFRSTYSTSTNFTTWQRSSFSSSSIGGPVIGTGDGEGIVIWSKQDIYNSVDGSLYFAATSPITSGETVTEKETITIDPIYVGDLPTKIETGEIDEEEGKEQILAPLPDYIDITKVIQSPETAVDDLTAWQQQVVDGQKSLEQSLKDITGDLEDIKDDIDNPGSEEPELPDTTTVGDYALDLTDFFPFCIPFDIFEFLSLLAAEPEAPVFEWAIQVPQLGKTFEVAVDLSPWNNVAALFRKLELLGFIVGLAYVTREKYIRG